MDQTPTTQTLTRAEEDALITAAALKLWQTFDRSERTGVRFGMFPAQHMRQAEAELRGIRDVTRRLSVAVMDCASRDGGMRA